MWGGGMHTWIQVLREVIFLMWVLRINLETSARGLNVLDY